MTEWTSDEEYALERVIEAIDMMRSVLPEEFWDSIYDRPKLHKDLNDSAMNALDHVLIALKVFDDDPIVDTLVVLTAKR